MEIFKDKISQNIFKDQGMKKLYTELIELLVPLNSSLQSNPKVISSMETLKQSRKNLVSGLVFHQLISQCLSSSGMDLRQCRGSPQIISDLKKVMVTCQLQEFFPINSPESTEESNILDINTDSFLEKAKTVISSEHKIVLLSMIKSYLECCCQKIIHFTFPSVTYSLTDGMLEVTKYICSLKEETNKKQLLLVNQKKYNASLIARLFSEMADYAVQLEYLVSNFRFSKHSLLHLQCLSISLKAHWLKMRCLELDVLCNTYTRVSVRALNKINHKLSERITSAENSLASVKNQLSKYDNLDYRFQNLMKEHATLQKDLQFFYGSQQVN